MVSWTLYITPFFYHLVRPLLYTGLQHAVTACPMLY